MQFLRRLHIEYENRDIYSCTRMVGGETQQYDPPSPETNPNCVVVNVQDALHLNQVMLLWTLLGSRCRWSTAKSSTIFGYPDGRLISACTTVQDPNSSAWVAINVCVLFAFFFIIRFLVYVFLRKKTARI